jgi:hypothetical protein
VIGPFRLRTGCFGRILDHQLRLFLKQAQQNDLVMSGSIFSPLSGNLAQARRAGRKESRQKMGRFSRRYRINTRGL